MRQPILPRPPAPSQSYRSTLLYPSLPIPLPSPSSQRTAPTTRPSGKRRESSSAPPSAPSSSSALSAAAFTVDVPSRVERGVEGGTEETVETAEGEERRETGTAAATEEAAEEETVVVGATVAEAGESRCCLDGAEEVFSRLVNISAFFLVRPTIARRSRIPHDEHPPLFLWRCALREKGNITLLFHRLPKPSPHVIPLFSSPIELLPCQAQTRSM